MKKVAVKTAAVYGGSVEIEMTSEVGSSYLCAGYTDERGEHNAHNPKVQFNEEVCPIEVSCLAHCATQWLKNHQ